jgi:ABC-type glycerol-3-phosphate transport system substrate-binding protein
MFDEIAAGFEKINPDIDVEMLYYLTQDELTVLMASGTQVDVVWANNVGWNNFYRPNDLLADITPYVKSDASLKLTDFFPGSLQPYNYAGGLYALPTGVGALALFYNTAITEELGLGAPPANWDWSNFETYLAKTIKVKPDGTFARFGADISSTIVRNIPFFDQNEVAMWDSKLQKALQPLDRALETLEFFYRNLNNRAIRPWAYVRSHTFANEGTTFIVEGPWQISLFSELKFPIGVAPLPRKRVSATWVATNGYGILKQSTHKNEAWRYLRYLTASHEGIEISRKYMTDLPARREALDAWLKQPTVGKIINTAEFARNLETARDSTIGVPNPGGLRTVYDANMLLLWREQMGPGAVLEELRNKIAVTMQTK